LQARLELTQVKPLSGAPLYSRPLPFPQTFD